MERRLGKAAGEEIDEELGIRSLFYLRLFPVGKELWLTYVARREPEQACLGVLRAVEQAVLLAEFGRACRSV